MISFKIRNQTFPTTIALGVLIITSLTVFAKNNESKKTSNSQIEKNILVSIQENILIPDSKKAIAESEKLNQLLQNLEAEQTQNNLLKTQTQFLKFMQAWKRVETLYSAGNIDSDMLDTTRYIDVYHTGKEDLTKQLQRALKSNKKVKRLLFKNSTKSINALEFLLFSNQDKTALLKFDTSTHTHRIKMAQHVTKNITQHLKDIHQFYLDDFTTNHVFTSQGKKSIEDIVNVLIDSSYKLLTWRVAEPGGFSDKYTGKPTILHLEYHLSSNSFYSIQSILNSFKDILNADKYLELGDLGEKQGVSEKIGSVKNNINKAISKNEVLIKAMSDNGRSLSQIILTKEYKDLHKSLIRLHNSFYILLIDSLGLKAKIIEADGD